MFSICFATGTCFCLSFLATPPAVRSRLLSGGAAHRASWRIVRPNFALRFMFIFALFLLTLGKLN